MLTNTKYNINNTIYIISNQDPSSLASSLTKIIKSFIKYFFLKINIVNNNDNNKYIKILKFKYNNITKQIIIYGKPSSTNSEEDMKDMYIYFTSPYITYNIQIYKFQGVPGVNSQNKILPKYENISKGKLWTYIRSLIIFHIVKYNISEELEKVKTTNIFLYKDNFDENISKNINTNRPIFYHKYLQDTIINDTYLDSIFEQNNINKNDFIKKI